MAVSFYSDQFTGDTCYTSQLQELRILTSAPHVNFYVYRQAQICLQKIFVCIHIKQGKLILSINH